MAEEKEEGSPLSSWDSWEIIIMDVENEQCEQPAVLPAVDVELLENSKGIGNGVQQNIWLVLVVKLSFEYT
jgi:hypothetical protein